MDEQLRLLSSTLSNPLTKTTLVYICVEILSFTQINQVIFITLTEFYNNLARFLTNTYCIKFTTFFVAMLITFIHMILIGWLGQQYPLAPQLTLK